MSSIKEKINLLSKSQSLTMLLDRLPEKHASRNFLERELYMEEAGQRGEKRMRHKFEEFYLEEEFLILWNVELKIGNWKVQMDGILLTSRTAIIIDSKNISGKIHFEKNTDEFYRIDDEGEKLVLDDPILQLEKHIYFLTSWFKLKQIDLPVDGLIVFTAKKCEFISKAHEAPICKTYQMNKRLYRILKKIPQKNSSYPLSDIKELLEFHRYPFTRIPLCKFYKLNALDLQTGVYCSKCDSRTMQRVKKNWHCRVCKHRDSDAHVLAMREYFSLIDYHVKNMEFREFCQIESVFTASRLLASFELKNEGGKRNRSYHLKTFE